MLENIIPHPKRLFLIDSMGAFLTAFLLGVVLTGFEEYTGVPRKVLIPLSLLACIFGIYSAGCHFFAGSNWRICLTVIAIANLLYCCITAGLIISLHPAITILGVTYFSVEIIVVVSLAIIELLTVSKKTHAEKI